MTSRPLEGEAPAIDLLIGNKTNTSPILRLFLSRVDQLKRAAPAVARLTTYVINL